MTWKRCRRCGIPHHEHPDANKSGGVGQLQPWDGEVCPICLDRRRELAKRAVWRYLWELLSPDDYVTGISTEPEQRTLGEMADA